MLDVLPFSSTVFKGLKAVTKSQCALKTRIYTLGFFLLASHFQTSHGVSLHVLAPSAPMVSVATNLPAPRQFVSRVYSLRLLLSSLLKYLSDPAQNAKVQIWDRMNPHRLTLDGRLYWQSLRSSGVQQLQR